MAETFFEAYVTAALWSTYDDEGTPLDDNYSISDIDAKTLERMKDDCNSFHTAVGHLLTEENCDYRGCPVEAYAGHDFWLTRNGHGCGFWDGDWEDEAGKELTRISKLFGEYDLYIGDDGTIYGHPA